MICLSTRGGGCFRIHNTLGAGIARVIHCLTEQSDKHFYFQARKEFEKNARIFMERTLQKARHLRPKAQWGYYGFPYCLNYGKNNSADCPQMVKQENDQ